MLKIIFSTLFIIFLTACAEKPDGIIVMNEETIENFFEKDKQSWNPPAHLNLLLDQPVVNASLPPIPQGLSRLYGTLTSNGSYTFAQVNAGIRDRGSSFRDSEFGMLGPAGHAGNAWFYADYNPQTGEISDARAYLYGFMGGVCDMRQKTGGTYGNIANGTFTLEISGPCLFPQVSGSSADYALLVQGKGNLLNPSFGGEMSINYIIDDTGNIHGIPANPRANGNIYDSGQGTAWLNR